MAIGMVKAFLFIGVFLSGFDAYAQIQPEPVEPELKVEIRSPIVKVVPGDHKINVVGGPCDLTEQQKAIAWKNVTYALTENYPEVLKYCETEVTPNSQIFIVVNDVCRTYITCVKTVDGVDILHGKFIVKVDETTQEVRGIHDVPW